MDKALRVVVGIVGIFFLLQGVGWIAQPKAAAEGLGMTLLDGLGRSTQVGDMTAFFVAIGVSIGLGAWWRDATWLHAAALLLGGAAVFRTLAWALHGADLAVQFILIETLVTVLLLIVAQRLRAVPLTA